MTNAKQEFNMILLEEQKQQQNKVVTRKHTQI
jgi:hypothetical protein